MKRIAQQFRTAVQTAASACAFAWHELTSAMSPELSLKPEYLLISDRGNGQARVLVEGTGLV